MKGLILIGVSSDAGDAERNGKCDSNLVKRDVFIVSCPLGEDEGLGTAAGLSEGGLRLRGTGGGMTGRSPYICVSSVSVGIGVVRALEDGNFFVNYRGAALLE